MYAAHASESVPTPPPTITRPSAARALRKSRVMPMPLGTTTWQYRLAEAASSCGIIPTVRPPASEAPLHASSMTPPRPPVISTEPDSATHLPTL